jgi:2,4-diketo-3-deoxy-L-fuconate hydrolase
MKLLRHGACGFERPGILDTNGRIRDLSSVVPDIGGDVLTSEGLAEIATLDLDRLPMVDPGTRIGACVGAVSKVIGVGQNYHDFVAHAGVPIPTLPVLFLKPPSTLCGPNDDIILPAVASQADWEAELGVIIGKTARAVSATDAMQYVAGFCTLNDITERAWIASSSQLLYGKGLDTFTPIGPYLVTRDEVKHPERLGIQLDLNGERRQDGNTASMIFDLCFLISHISRLMTLMPGDVLATGTPAGVGARASPPVFLRPGDRLRLAVELLGEQNARVVAAPHFD